MTVSPKLRRFLLGQLAGAVIVALAGVALILRLELLGRGLRDASYDLPFHWRSDLETAGVVLVFVDDESRKHLGQTAEGMIDRRHFVSLLKRLTADRAALVVFDVVFERQEPAVDREFADAIRAHGRVVLGGIVEKRGQQTTTVGVKLQPLVSSNPQLVSAATNWGLLMVAGDDARRATRQLLASTSDYETAPWVAARLDGAPVTRDPAARFAPRWLNYYGPPCPFEFTTLEQALAPDGVPPGFFTGKSVFVGGLVTNLRNPGAADVFATPYSRLGERRSKDKEPVDDWTIGKFSPGVEVLATAFLNLKRGEWLEELSLGWELALVLVCGGLAGGTLLWLRPWHAAWVSILMVTILTAGSSYLQFRHRLWWPWLVPVAVQWPLGLVWSVAYQYAIEGGRRRRLLKAFSSYVSPHLAGRVAESEMDLRLGGRKLEATILFSDLQGFTTKSEGLEPEKLSEMLTAYFTRLTQHIYSEDGTVIKFLGDGLMAVWGAPLPDSRHAARAVRAAWHIIESSRATGAFEDLQTRIGINTGPVLAGNLGSAYRFDYTVIGATTNLASRLEGLNKVLGTSLLIAESTRLQLGDDYWLRRLGRFVLRGTTRPVSVFEVLGIKRAGATAPGFMGPFEEALGAMEQRDAPRAAAGFRKVTELRGGRDGPSEFYLRRTADEDRRLTVAEAGFVVDLRRE